METKLSDLFENSRGKPVEWAGHLVHMMYEMTGLTADQELLIQFEQPAPARPQALRIRARGGFVELNGEFDDVAIWSDHAPEKVVMGFRPVKAGEPMTIRIWNAWRDPAGTMQAWIGNSGMLIQERDDGSTLLRCSDGFDDPSFNDLVVALSVGVRRLTMQTVPAIYVGAIMGDSDSESIWGRAIGELSGEVEGLSKGVVSPVGLSIVYHVDGRIAPNEFEGVRTGRFDRRANRLVVQAAIPRSPVDGKREMLVTALLAAIDEAERYVVRKGLAEGLPEIRTLVGRVARTS